MDANNKSSGYVPPEHFAAQIEAFIREPRPKWANMAIAKIIRIIFPNISVNQWLRLLETPELIAELISLEDEPWFWGRIARSLAEMRKIGPEHFPFFATMPWILGMRFENGTFVPGEGRGLEEIIIGELQKQFHQPAEKQVRFWQAFSTGFARNMMPRPQDGEAFVIYIFLVANWKEVSRRQNVRDLYGFVFSRLPKRTCPNNEDPIDFEEKHIKWFEKICHRNLGLHLAKRGRPELLR